MTDLNEKALEAASLAYNRKHFDMTRPDPTEYPEAGGGPIGYAIRAYLSAINTSEPKQLEWTPVVEGGRDIQSQTEFGLYVISVDSSFAGGTHYLWTPGQRDYDADHHSEHRGMTSARAAAQADYEACILSALTTTSGDEDMRVIDPDQWEPCSPAYLSNGGRCDAPRVWNAKDRNHWHPKLLYARPQSADVRNEIDIFERLRNAYLRGARWRDENGSLELVMKAASDYADYQTSRLHSTQTSAVRDEHVEPADPWLSIDSAPKDGTRIVGWGNGEARVTTHERYRKGSIGYAEGRQDTWWEYIERETCFHWAPTHWIPLPAALALHSTQEG